MTNTNELTEVVLKLYKKGVIIKSRTVVKNFYLLIFINIISILKTKSRRSDIQKLKKVY